MMNLIKFDTPCETFGIDEKFGDMEQSNLMDEITKNRWNCPWGFKPNQPYGWNYKK